MKKVCRELRRMLLLLCCVILLCTGCTSEESEKKLWVLIDLDNFVGEENERFFQALEYLGNFNRQEVNLEFLPTEQSEREVRLSYLRTEIMAGKGPDVFILPCYFSGWKSGYSLSFWNGWKSADSSVICGAENQEWLFPDVESAMRNQLFLPLDDFLVHAEFLDTHVLHPAVFESGRTEEGQMVLPITFTFPSAVYQKSLLKNGKIQGTSWVDALNEADPAVQKAYGIAAWNQFSDLFPALTADHGQRLAFSREELLRAVKSVLKATDSNLLTLTQEEMEKSFSIRNNDIESPLFPAGEFQGFLSERSIDSWDLRYWASALYDHRWEQDGKEQIIEPIRNTEGGVTAGVTAFCCINRNTRFPEKSFRVVDILFATQIQNGYGESQAEQNGKSKLLYQTHLLSDCYGIPVRNDLMKDAEFAFRQGYLSQVGKDYGRSEGVFSEYTALRNEVTHARFYGALDQELQTMYEACLEAKTDEEIEKIVSKAYDTMLMILAES